MSSEASLVGSYGDKVNSILTNSIFNTTGDKVIRSYIMGNLKQSGDNYCIPTVEILADLDENIKRELLALYEKNFCFADTSCVDEDIKLLQASCLNGLVFGVNHDKGDTLSLYTSNIELIFGICKESKFDLSKALEMNKQRIVHAVRFDIVSDVKDNVTFVAKNLNKNTNLQVVDPSTGLGRFHIIPFEYIDKSLELFKLFLDNKYVMEVSQYTGEIIKKRIITTKVEVLEKFCDEQEFVWGLKPTYNPYKAFMYAPVVGANSFTAGVTRIDLINVTRIARLQKMPSTMIKADKNDFITEKAVMGWLEDLKVLDEARYQNVVDTLPDRGNILTGSVNDIKSGLTSTSTVAHYWHSVSDKVRASIINKYSDEIQEYINRYTSIFVKNEKIDVNTITSDLLKSILKNNVVKAIIKKEDGMYSNMVVTNNKDILSNVYGEDYFAKKESFGVRLWELQNRLDADNSLPSMVSALDFCGFPDDDDTIAKIKEAYAGEGENLHQRLADALKDDVNTRANRSPELSETTIKARSILSTLYGGSRDFYKDIDLSKAISLTIVG